jgi:hypothetical protein
VAEKHAVECLRCGGFRTIERERSQRLDPGECNDCGYVGWALLTDLTEATRKILRERPPEWRGNGHAGLRAV